MSRRDAGLAVLVVASAGARLLQNITSTTLLTGPHVFNQSKSLVFVTTVQSVLAIAAFVSFALLVPEAYCMPSCDLTGSGKTENTQQVHFLVFSSAIVFRILQKLPFSL